MSLQAKINERIWQTIQNSYEKANFTGAILESIYFLSDLIREKSGLESDGVVLAGQAFGGKNPKLKVNKLQSDSEKNIQAGIEQIIRGIYKAVRNPRSHAKWNDSKEDADSIILFINYLIQIIDRAKSPFTKNEFIKRIFDSDFVKKDRYAELLVSEIPQKQMLDVFFGVYEGITYGNVENLKLFMKTLINSLNEDDLKQVYAFVSDEFKIIEDEDSIGCFLEIMPPEILKHLDEISRLRLENKIIKSIWGAGSLAVKASCWFKYFHLKDDLIRALLGMLDSNKEENSKYVLDNLFFNLLSLVNPPSEEMLNIIKTELIAGNKDIYNAINFYFNDSDMPEEWKGLFREESDIPF